ncbi:MAG: FKBP-type peptidyl-prolyl cis-trans isomerase [Thiobacillaceae bacterium]
MTARVVRMGDRVTLHYRLECGGEEVVSTFSDAPETFTLGSGEIDPRLEVLLLGLKTDDHSTMALSPGEAFGDRDEGLVQRMARSDFDPALNLQPGHTVDFGLPNGQTLHGTILGLDDTHVVVDFNHPLAGLPVEFEVRILAIE